MDGHASALFRDSYTVNTIHMLTTPLVKACQLSTELDVELWVKRDDLFPVSGGGNKGRKILPILREAEKLGRNALVTTGGLQSNHARVVALAAANRDWHCSLLLHGDPHRAKNPSGNLLLMHLAGAEIEVVEPSSIGKAMSTAVRACEKRGLKPYGIPGGGHSILGALAYVEAVDELRRQCQENTWYPDWIVLASGTGTTQAGLIVGIERIGWHTRVLGISVARKNPRGTNIVRQACASLRTHLGIEGDVRPIDFRDDWVGEGYEKANPQVLSVIQLAAKSEGLILDPTYTGKAFAALLDVIKTDEISRKSKVLFWHTGGLLNLIASQYFSEEN